METFRIQNLSFAYPGPSGLALEKVCLDVAEGSFLVLCGQSGCGKTTLLRQLKPSMAPHGTREGTILFRGHPLEDLDRREESQAIGFVSQSPDNQLVTDKVWHELAFGLESLGLPTSVIRRRVAEMASFFGIEDWFHRDTAQLSGGQKQLLALASIMVMQPKVLLLDEPTSQLDPIAAEEFLAVLGRINRELGTTVILSEHRLEEALPLADTAAVLDGGRLLAAGRPREVGRVLRERGHAMFRAMPTPMRVWAAVETETDCPVTVREGRNWLKDLQKDRGFQPLPPEPVRSYPKTPVLAAEELWFRYDREGRDIVQGLSLAVHPGEFLALLGGNGAGKSTALTLLAGLNRPQRGEVNRRGKTALLPQDPRTLFLKKTVEEDLLDVSRDREALERVCALCGMTDLLNRHPYDLSGGEQQRSALAKILLLKPDVLLLDEPTKGLDAAFQDQLAEILDQLLSRGVAIIMVSHDVAFCADHAHRCALFFQGSVAAEGSPRDFFSGNRFYTTAAGRMARDILPGAVTARDVTACCGGAVPPLEVMPYQPRKTAPAEEPPKPRPLPMWRKALAALSGGMALLSLIRALRLTDLSKLMTAAGLSRAAGGELGRTAWFLLWAFVCALALGGGERTSPQTVPGRKKLPRRTRMAAGCLLLMIPVTLFAGTFYLGDRKYYFIALLMLLEGMLPFFLAFEGRRPGAREVTLLACLCALGVAGRAAFFMLPQAKPVLALTILAGVALGGESGFLVGGVTMLVSNILFGQGPWTPWQMFGMGIVGFLAGVLARTGWLRRSRGSLCAFGAVSAVLIYGGILNTASALMAAGELNRGVLLTYYLAGFPMDCVHGLSTAAFLWLGAEPMLEKLERLKTKYGLDGFFNGV